MERSKKTPRRKAPPTSKLPVQLVELLKRELRAWCAAHGHTTSVSILRAVVAPATRLEAVSWLLSALAPWLAGEERAPTLKEIEALEMAFATMTEVVSAFESEANGVGDEI